MLRRLVDAGLNQVPAQWDPVCMSAAQACSGALALAFCLIADGQESTDAVSCLLHRMVASSLICVGWLLGCLAYRQALRAGDFTRHREMVGWSVSSLGQQFSTAALLVTVDPDWLTLVVVLVANAYSHHAAYTYYRHFHSMKQQADRIPPSLVVLVCVHVLLAWGLFWLGRETFFEDVLLQLTLIGLAGFQVYQCWWYIRQFDWSEAATVASHAKFVVTTVIFSMQYLFGLVSPAAYLFGVVCVTWRLNTHYLLRAVLFHRDDLDTAVTRSAEENPEPPHQPSAGAAPMTSVDEEAGWHAGVLGCTALLVFAGVGTKPEHTSASLVSVESLLPLVLYAAVVAAAIHELYQHRHALSCC